jgi:hypothetical protein
MGELPRIDDFGRIEQGTVWKPFKKYVSEKGRASLIALR